MYFEVGMKRGQCVAGQSGGYYRRDVAMVTLYTIIDQISSPFKAYFIVELGMYITSMSKVLEVNQLW